RSTRRRSRGDRALKPTGRESRGSRPESSNGTSTMIVHTWRPRPPLAQFVDSFWQFDAGGILPRRERRLPTGTLEIVIDLNDDALEIYADGAGRGFRQFRAGLLCGVMSSYAITNASRLAIGVHFRPGGAAPFFRVPLGELLDENVPLDCFWGAGAR